MLEAERSESADDGTGTGTNVPKADSYGLF